MIPSQVELERMMHNAGMIRSRADFDRAEERGYAADCKYSHSILRDYVPPLAATIAQDTRIDKRGAGVLKKYVALLRSLDNYAVAYLAVSSAVSFIMQRASDKKDVAFTALSRHIGGRIHDELVASQIATQNMELFVHISKELYRRMSKKVRHRMAHLRHAAAANGVVWDTWAVGDIEHVGMYLVRLLHEAGMITVDESTVITRNRTQDWAVSVSDGLERRMQRMRYLAGVTGAVFGPCSESPKDWVSLTDGGWHTHDMRRALPFVVRCRPNAREEIRTQSLRPPLDALNYAQRTGWRVNRRVLQVAKDLLASGIETEEVLSHSPPPKPGTPTWLVEGLDKATFSQEQRNEFVQWKREVSEWHTQNKLRSIRLRRMASSMRVAEYFKDASELFFVYFFCSRGRMYPLGGIMNPQGSDFNKALLEFSKGVEYTEGSRGAYHIRKQVANLWGFDKAPHDARVAWTEDRMSMLLRIAADPVANTEWLQADKPWQFLQCVQELAELVTHKRVIGYSVGASFDGSCNGLQHLSAMARDPVGGAMVNLVPASSKSDIYAAVAGDVMQYLRTLHDEPLAAAWLQRGVDRSIMKRPVMTIPYNVTFLGARDQILAELRPGEFPSNYEAAQFLAQALWKVRKNGVLTRSIELQKWMEKSVAAILRNAGEDAVIHWTTPSGFPATQVYQEYDTVRINAYSVSGKKIRINVATENGTPDAGRHRLAFPPNLLHSIDASHMHMVSNAASKILMPLRLVHDDYGCHAANGDALESLVKQEFVTLHRHRPLEMLKERYPEIPDVPAYGSLDIENVKYSTFSFD